METRKILVMVMAVVLWLGCGITSADEWWYVDPCGVDAPSGGDPCNPFATIAYAIEQCSDDANDIIYVNTGGYETGPLFLKSNMVIDFNDVMLEAWSITDPCSGDSQDPDDPCSFRYFSGVQQACLFEAVAKSNITLQGSGTTILDGNRGQYPMTWTFNTGTDVDLDANSITITDHRYNVGDKIKYSNGGGTTIGGLTKIGYYGAVEKACLEPCLSGRNKL